MKAKNQGKVPQPTALTSEDVQHLLDLIDRSKCREIDLAFGGIALSVRLPDPGEESGEGKS